MLIASGKSTGYTPPASVLCGTGDGNRFWLPHQTPEHIFHPSPCLGTTLLHGRKKFLFDRYFLGRRTSSKIPFTENLRALLSNLFASPYLSQISQLQMVIPEQCSQTKQAHQRFPILLPYQVSFLSSHGGALRTVSQPCQESNGL